MTCRAWRTSQVGRAQTTSDVAYAATGLEGFTPWASALITRSRSVTTPTSLPASTTGKIPTLLFRICSAASINVAIRSLTSRRAERLLRAQEVKTREAEKKASAAVQIVSPLDQAMRPAVGVVVRRAPSAIRIFSTRGRTMTGQQFLRATFPGRE